MDAGETATNDAETGTNVVGLHEDVSSDALGSIPKPAPNDAKAARLKVIRAVPERFSSHSRETTMRPPAPLHPMARGRAGAGPLAMILSGKYNGAAQP